MSRDVLGIHEYVRGTVAGQCAIAAALVIALHETGVLPKNTYIDALNRLWIDMPEEEAVGEAGAAIERMLDLLNASTGSILSSDDTVRKQSVSEAVRRPINGDVAA